MDVADDSFRHRAADGKAKLAKSKQNRLNKKGWKFRNNNKDTAHKKNTSKNE
jgi:hypothetical protein